MIKKSFLYLNIIGIVLTSSFSFGVSSQSNNKNDVEVVSTSIPSPIELTERLTDNTIVLFEDMKVKASGSKIQLENRYDIQEALDNFKHITEEKTGIGRKNFGMGKFNIGNKNDEKHSTLEDFFMTKSAPITYFTALSLDGGGIRGYLEALFLEELHKQVKKPLHKIFDYIGGTSIGGILSLGLTTPSQSDADHPAFEPADMINLFKYEGKEIFPTYSNFSKYVSTPITKTIDHWAWKFKSLSYSGYKATNLEKLLKNKLGEKSYLDNTLTNVAVTSVRVGKESQPFIFDSYQAKRSKKTNLIVKSIPLWEVGRSTSAAPTYFPAHIFKHQRIENEEIMSEDIQLIDGGLWLNNPASFVARQLYKWVEAQNMIIWPKNIVMLSLGTGYTNSDYSLEENTGVLKAIRPLIDILMTTSSMNVDLSMKELMGKNYFRINPQLSKNISLDSTEPDTLEILEEAFEKESNKIEEFVEKRLRKVLELDLERETK